MTHHECSTGRRNYVLLDFVSAMLSRSFVDSITLDGEIAVVREVEYTALVDSFAQSFVQQMERIRELNAGPTGEGIANTQFGYLNNAAIGAALITMQALVLRSLASMSRTPSARLLSGWKRGYALTVRRPLCQCLRLRRRCIGWQVGIDPFV